MPPLPGIDTSIRNEVLNDEEACQRAFVEKKDYVPECNVMLFDLMTELYSLFNVETKNNSFTGAEFYRAVCRVVLRPLQNGRCHTSVVCLDDPTRVPVEKKREQQSRDDARVCEALPDSTVFSDEGASFYQGMAPVRFDIRMALANRSLRPRLCGYLIDCFRKQLVLPQSQKFILDYEVGGAWVLTEGSWGQDPTSAHEYGEADLSLIYWAQRLLLADPNTSVCIRSTDSDQIPLTLNLLTHCLGSLRKKQRVILRYWRGKTAERYMDMRLVYRWVTERLGWSVTSFVTFCCLCGTDFTDPNVVHEGEKKKRRLLFPGISAKTVFEACQRFGVPALLERVPSELHAFGFVVRAVYTHVVTSVKGRATLGLPIEFRKQLQEEFEQKGGTKPFRLQKLAGLMHPKSKMQLPTQDQLMEVFDQLQFNLRYWMIDFTALQQTRPERGVPTSMELTGVRPAGMEDIPLLKRKQPQAETSSKRHKPSP